MLREDKNTFFTVVDGSFLPGAFALMRSVRTFFPEAKRIIKIHGQIKWAQIWSQLTNIAQIQKSDSIEMKPKESYYRNSFSRFNIGSIPGEYLIYIDADAFLSGRVSELLSVPHGKLGITSEHHYGYKFYHQLKKKEKVSLIAKRYGVGPSEPSLNTGVIAGHRGAWERFWTCLLRAQKKSLLFEASKGNQGVVQPLLTKENMHYELSRSCNELSKGNWNGKTPTVLHFTKGRTRPWETGPSRRDNSYPAFAEWRKYSNVVDFLHNGTFLQELFWRSLDDLRPFIRKYR